MNSYLTAGSIGFVLWYLYFGFECAMNGGTICPVPSIFMPFYHLWYVFLHHLPFVGKKFRLEWADGDEEWAQDLYHPIYFFVTCVILPLSPILAVWFKKSN